MTMSTAPVLQPIEIMRVERESKIWLSEIASEKPCPSSSRARVLAIFSSNTDGRQDGQPFQDFHRYPDRFQVPDTFHLQIGKQQFLQRIFE